MDFNHLPNDILANIIEILSYSDLLKLCQANERVAQLCESESIWYRRLNRDYPNYTKYHFEPKYSLKDIYHAFETKVLDNLVAYDEYVEYSQGTETYVRTYILLPNNTLIISEYGDLDMYDLSTHIRHDGLNNIKSSYRLYTKRQYKNIKEYLRDTYLYTSGNKLCPNYDYCVGHMIDRLEYPRRRLSFNKRQIINYLYSILQKPM